MDRHRFRKIAKPWRGTGTNVPKILRTGFAAEVGIITEADMIGCQELLLGGMQGAVEPPLASEFSGLEDIESRVCGFGEQVSTDQSEGRQPQGREETVVRGEETVEATADATGVEGRPWMKHCCEVFVKVVGYYG